MSVVRRILPLPAPGETAFLSGVLRSESVGGLLALGAALVALVWANSPADSSYHAFITFDLGPLDLEHWGADGALTLFFFVAGLELKREFVVGSLRRPADALVPVTAALCGVAVPAVLYTLVNVTASSGRPAGWAIPAATRRWTGPSASKTRPTCRSRSCTGAIGSARSRRPSTRRSGSRTRGRFGS